MASQKITLNLLHKSILTNFLDGFTDIAENLLLEIENGTLIAKSSTPDHILFRSVSCELANLFDPADLQKLPKEIILWSVFKTTRAISILKTFENEIITCTFSLEWSDNDSCWYVDSIKLNDDQLKIQLPILSYKLIDKIDKNTYLNIINVESADFSFQLTKIIVSKFKNLIALNSETEVGFAANKGKITFFSKDFDYILSNSDKSISSKVLVKKDYLKHLENETWNVSVLSSDSKIVFSSEESNKYLVVGTVDE